MKHAFAMIVALLLAGRIAGLAADGVLVPEIANRFGIGDAATVFSAWTAGRLPARQVTVREG